MVNGFERPIFDIRLQQMLENLMFDIELVFASLAIGRFSLQLQGLN